MADPIRSLAEYPYVVLRVRCNQCKRANSYRLARLAEAFGAGISMDDLMGKLFVDCPWRLDPSRPKYRKYEAKCLAYLPDLHPQPRPPDLPPGLLKLRVIVGGRG